MEPLDYLKAVARRWRLVVTCMLLAGAAAVVTAPQEGPSQPTFVSYSATATLLSDPATADRSLGFTRLFMQRGALPQRVADVLGTGRSGPQVASEVAIQADEEVGTVAITASGDDAAEVEKLVNTYAQTTIEYFDEQAAGSVEKQLTALQQRLDAVAAELGQLDDRVAGTPGDSVLEAQRSAKSAEYASLLQQRQALVDQPVTAGLSVLEPGTALQQSAGGFTPPSSRSHRLALGLLAGALLGTLLALVVDRLDTRVRSRNEVQQLSGTAVLAEIPRMTRRMRRSARPAALLEPSGAFAESHRTVRSALTLLPAHSLSGSPGVDGVTHQPPSRVVLVVSARAREGKSTTVANLAATIASPDRSVLVIDADLRRPTLGRALGVPAGMGLADLAASGSTDSLADLPHLLRRTNVDNVWLLDAGTPERYATVSPLRLADVVRRARDLADVVLIDVAPVLSASDALDLVSSVDAALLVVRSGRTTREQLRHVTEVLARTRVPVVGSVLAGVPRSQLRSLGRSSESPGYLHRVPRADVTSPSPGAGIGPGAAADERGPR
jgi:capsular exopolysaccharide synthesis family protein